MRNLRLLFFVALSIFFINSGVIFSLEVLYVQSESAKIFDKPSFDGNLINTVTKGYRIDVLEKKGNWVKTSVNGKEGYISSFILAKNPPSEKISSKKEETVESPRKRASEHTTAVAGVRGLTEDDRKRLSIEGKVNFEALENIENIRISKDDIRKFIEEGEK
ncbi:MAG: SH3 domain-containing protein [Proteobacteria bacterium]|nr:SH3 domain-containing protein [Pseudomonadota bacterium]